MNDDGEDPHPAQNMERGFNPKLETGLNNWPRSPRLEHCPGGTVLLDGDNSLTDEHYVHQRPQATS